VGTFLRINSFPMERSRNPWRNISELHPSVKTNWPCQKWEHGGFVIFWLTLVAFGLWEVWEFRRNFQGLWKRWKTCCWFSTVSIRHTARHNRNDQKVWCKLKDECGGCKFTSSALDHAARTAAQMSGILFGRPGSAPVLN